MLAATRAQLQARIHPIAEYGKLFSHQFSTAYSKMSKDFYLWKMVSYYYIPLHSVLHYFEQQPWFL